MKIKDEITKSAENIEEGAQSFLLISVSAQGKCEIQGTGDVTQMTFMSKSLDLFIHKLINGDFGNPSPPGLRVVK